MPSAPVSEIPLERVKRIPANEFTEKIKISSEAKNLFILTATSQKAPGTDYIWTAYSSGLGVRAYLILYTEPLLLFNLLLPKAVCGCFMPKSAVSTLYIYALEKNLSVLRPLGPCSRPFQVF